MGCSLANLGECLPESFLQFFLDIFNAPLEPLLWLVQKLFTEPVDIAGFKSLWLIMVSIIGLFYGLAFLYAGFNFIVAGFDASRKETAKRWLRDTILMAITVNASYWLYGLLVEMGALLTAGVYSLIGPDFFRLTSEIFGELGMSLLLTVVYVLMLLATVIILVVRYILVAAGVMIFPWALFLYFLPPLRSLGQLLLWLCGTVIFLPFLGSIGLLMASKLVTLDLFVENKVMLMIAAFLVVNLSLIGMWAFAVAKSAMSLLDVNVTQALSSTLGTVNTVRSIRRDRPAPPDPYSWDPSDLDMF